MKMKNLNTIKMSIVVIAILCGLLHSAIAQAANTQQWHKIHLQHIRPDMLAYWLDSAHQRIPVEYQESFPASFGSNSEEPFLVYMPKSKMPSKLQLSTPSNISFDGLLSADDSKQDLWMFSTQDVFNKTQTIVDQLDQPIRQIDLKVQAVVGDMETMKTFVNLGSPTQSEMESAEIQPRLDQLKAQGKVKVSSLSLTVANGFTGSTNSFVSTPFFLSTHAPGIGSEIGPSSKSEPLNYIIKYVYAVANPILNNDKTVTVTVDLGTKFAWTNQTPPVEITKSWFDNIARDNQPMQQNLFTVCTLANNRTIALGGMRNTSTKTNDKHLDQETVWFITAHYAQ